MNVRAVVFDIGNVLLRWDPVAFYDARLGPARRRAFFSETGIEALNLDIDRGAPFREAVHAHAARHPDWADEIRHWHDSWGDFLLGPIDGSVAILDALRAAGMPVFALSNFGRAPLAIAEARLPWLRDFDRRYISGEMGVVKPDPAIYAAVEADCDLPREALFFIDDKPENISAAQARGWQGHVFTSPEALQAALSSAGVSGI